MAKLTRMTGMNTVLKNLRKSTRSTGLDVEQRLMKGGLFLQRESQKVVPVDTSNLKGGAETRNIGGRSFKADIIVMYKAVYAIFVHEDLDAKHKTGKIAKYLESVAREKLKEIFRIIGKG